MIVVTAKSVTGFVILALGLIRVFLRKRSNYKSFTKEQDVKVKAPRGINLDPNKPLPEILPSLTEIKQAIPDHCFRPTIAESMQYVVKDVFLVSLAFAVMYLVHNYANLPVWCVAVVMYWCVQGTLFTSLFVLGHDCGHGSFSNNPNVNTVVGMVLHTFILSPYIPWRTSHRHHHKNNNNIDRDEVFHPIRRRVRPAGEQSTIKPGKRSGFMKWFGMGLGWYFYIIQGYGNRGKSHFDFAHRFFRSNIVGCIVSLTLYFSWLAFMLHLAVTWFGVLNWVIYYAVPDFIFASYMVTITFLHHHEENVAWYSDHKWDYVRGQLSSIDRHYGPVHDIIHNIGTHQIHHLFPKIPHYHLEEATAAFRKTFPELVRVCDESIVESLSRMNHLFNIQWRIDPATEVHYYHDDRIDKLNN